MVRISGSACSTTCRPHIEGSGRYGAQNRIGYFLVIPQVLDERGPTRQSESVILPLLASVCDCLQGVLDGRDRRCGCVQIALSRFRALQRCLRRGRRGGRTRSAARAFDKLQRCLCRGIATGGACDLSGRGVGIGLYQTRRRACRLRLCTSGRKDTCDLLPRLGYLCSSVGPGSTDGLDLPPPQPKTNAAITTTHNTEPKDLNIFSISFLSSVEQEKNSGCRGRQSILHKEGLPQAA